MDVPVVQALKSATRRLYNRARGTNLKRPGTINDFTCARFADAHSPGFDRQKRKDRTFPDTLMSPPSWTLLNKTSIFGPQQALITHFLADTGFFSSFLLLSSLELSDTKCKSLKYEPSSEPLHISAIKPKNILQTQGDRVAISKQAKIEQAANRRRKSVAEVSKRESSLLTTYWSEST